MSEHNPWRQLFSESLWDQIRKIMRLFGSHTDSRAPLARRAQVDITGFQVIPQ